MIEMTDKQRRFCRTYDKNGGNPALICRELGISMRQFNRYMAQGSVKEYLACSMQRAKDMLTAALPSITEGLIAMYNSPDTDPKVRVAIA